MLKGKNIGLSTTRSIEIGRGWEHVFCSSQIIQHHTVSLKEVNYLLPLYVFPKDLCKTELISNISWPIDQDGRIPNLSPDFILALEKNISLKFVSSDEGDLKVTFGPENVFHYIYAILHSPTYRLRYSDQLKRDFPKVCQRRDKTVQLWRNKTVQFYLRLLPSHISTHLILKSSEELSPASCDP
jgi:hypothetical protein